jgi:hypothetical protein
MTTSLAIAITSAIVQLAGYAIYNWAMLAGRTRPNLTSWLVWGGISFLNTFTYFSLSSHDFVVSLMPFTITAVNVLTLGLIMWYGRFQRINRVDATALIISVIAISIWQFTSSSSIANLMIQLAIIIGTVPTVLGVWRDPAVERPLPWFLWSGAFILAIIVVTMRHVSWVAYASPVIQFGLYLAIGLLARRK